MKIFNKEGKEIELLESKELNTRDYIGYISNNSTFDFELELNKCYLITILNVYNVSDLFFISTGHAVAESNITKIISNSYFDIKSKGKTGFRVISGEANGDIFALKLT